MYKLYYTSQEKKDAKKLKKSGLKDQTVQLLDIIAKDPYESLPQYEKLSGDLLGCYSRRINIQHRLVYQIYEKEKSIKIIRMWTHYE